MTISTSTRRGASQNEVYAEAVLRENGYSTWLLKDKEERMEFLYNLNTRQRVGFLRDLYSEYDYNSQSKKVDEEAALKGLEEFRTWAFENGRNISEIALAR